MNIINKFIFIFLLLPLVAFAADLPSWSIIPDESSLTFTATQNGAPVTGKFKNFSGVINFDPEKLDKSSVKIVVNTGSLSDAYNQLAETLTNSEWLNTKVFPQAIFQSTGFVKIDDKSYQAKGTLTIRGKTQPVVLEFTQQEYSETKAKITGSTTIKRNAFGVGQGEWSDTSAVKDDVRVDFTISAVKK